MNGSGVRVPVGVAWGRGRGASLAEVVAVVAALSIAVSVAALAVDHNRDESYTVVCARNLQGIGQALSRYLADNGGVYPPSYAYPSDAEGTWDPEDQDPAHPYGYAHWSWLLYDGGGTRPTAFQCPAMTAGGAPRTNPGPDAADWEAGQVDQNQASAPNPFVDRQTPRIAYTANAAMLPRNKFTQFLSGANRINVFVPSAGVNRPDETTVMTEFLDNWKGLCIQAGGSLVSKSHRPINPFYHLASGWNEYQSMPGSPGFLYGLQQSGYEIHTDPEDYGLLPWQGVRNRTNILDHTSGLAQINAVGRHHPGGDSLYGGTANFLMGDGHGERMTVLDSLIERKWGDRYYGLSGHNLVLNYSMADWAADSE